jgi:hypothetical protein
LLALLCWRKKVLQFRAEIEELTEPTKGSKQAAPEPVRRRIARASKRE